MGVNYKSHQGRGNRSSSIGLSNSFRLSQQRSSIDSNQLISNRKSSLDSEKEFPFDIPLNALRTSKTPTFYEPSNSDNDSVII